MLPLLLVLLLGAPPSSASGARLAAKAFGNGVEVEVRDLPAASANEMIRKALAEISEVERLTDASRTDGGVAALNAAAGKGPQAVDPRVLAVLARALDFCLWSEGAHGPLGRDLYSLWGLRTQGAERPAPESVERAVGSAACSRLTLDQQRATVTLAGGSGLDLWGFAEGFAVDRAVEVLRQGGASNGYVRIGSVQRAFGPGPGSKPQGWPAGLPPVPGLEGSAGQVYLRDSSLATASRADHPLRDPGAAFPYVNQRTGLPAQGVQLTAAVTELALDAQGLAVSLLLTGPREGELRIGSLRPRPSVLWFLGSGVGTPLQVGYRWSEVSRK